MSETGDRIDCQPIISFSKTKRNNPQSISKKIALFSKEMTLREDELL